VLWHRTVSKYHGVPLVVTAMIERMSGNTNAVSLPKVTLEGVDHDKRS